MRSDRKVDQAMGRAMAREGWLLCDSGYGTVIEKDDESSVFKNDDEALEYVRQQAREGSELHQYALDEVIQILDRPRDVSAIRLGVNGSVNDKLIPLFHIYATTALEYTRDGDESAVSEPLVTVWGSDHGPDAARVAEAIVEALKEKL